MSELDADAPTDVCLVLKTRRAARAITRRYNAMLKPLGLQCTQASLLFAIARGGFASIKDLAEQLAIERSAMTRNLRLLQQAGLVSSDAQGQGRAHRVHLTKAGRAMVKTCLPLWHTAQNAVRRELGESQWANTQTTLSRLGAIT